MISDLIKKIIYKLRWRVKSEFLNLVYLKNPKRYIPIFYYDINNVGDKLTPYLIEKITGKPTINVSSKFIPRIMGVGSLLHFSSSKSVVWGTGMISKDDGLNAISLKNIVGLRGYLTKKQIQDRFQQNIDCFIGDPAIILPRLYSPCRENIEYQIGLIPHYVDEEIAADLLSQLPHELRKKVHLITVKQEVETFIQEVTSCRKIVSSSLHGLIISDAYEIPNQWVELSKNVIGERFKFYDYYSSTTSQTYQSPVLVNSIDNLITLLNRIELSACVHRYSADLPVLEESVSLALKKLEELNS